MTQQQSATARRRFLGGMALGAASLAAGRTTAAPVGDAHAAGYDVAAAGEFMTTVPRKSGDPVSFTFSLDHNPVKATSGGWAREVTARHLPLAGNIAGAHLFMNAGGSREMHWHSTAGEWAYILAGQCQIVVLDPDGVPDVANCASGDLWFFPKGHAHAISTLGDAPCHALLTFDDGLFSERGTFGISDWLSRFDAATLARNFAVPVASFAGFPQGETYINQGEIIPLDGEAARAARDLPAEQSHRYRLMAAKPWRSYPGGTLHLASAREFPMSANMSGLITQLKPGAMQELHWHPNANEWFYVARGRARATLFGADKRMAVAELAAGDCGYFPQGWGHSLEALGNEPCEIVSSLDNGVYQHSSISEWIAKVPRHVLGNNLAATDAILTQFPRQPAMISGGA
ncbi:MAG TPA: cupin domain-containing protein [Acetobacteraceae bacterium]|nr:cupin domain-containing protein [Acetobacteraceae bacterium]